MANHLAGESSWQDLVEDGCEGTSPVDASPQLQQQRSFFISLWRTHPTSLPSRAFPFENSPRSSTRRARERSHRASQTQPIAPARPVSARNLRRRGSIPLRRLSLAPYRMPSATLPSRRRRLDHRAQLATDGRRVDDGRLPSLRPARPSPRAFSSTSLFPADPGREPDGSSPLPSPSPAAPSWHPRRCNHSASHSPRTSVASTASRAWCTPSRLPARRLRSPLSLSCRRTAVSASAYESLPATREPCRRIPELRCVRWRRGRWRECAPVPSPDLLSPRRNCPSADRPAAPER